MAGYFEHLVVRVLQPQAELQPRLPARFEPVGSQVEASWLHTAGLEEQVQERDTSPRTPSAPLAAPVTDLAGKSDPPARSEPAREVLSLATPAHNTPARAALQAPASTHPQTDASAPKGSPPAATVGTSAPDSMPARQLRVPLQNAAPLPAAPPLISQASPQPPPGSDARPREQVQPPHHYPGRVFVQPAILPPVPQPRPVKALDRIEAPTEQPSLVNVTIGRIEVRAAPPAASPKKPRTAAPVMGLDEYLKKRSGGQG